MGVNEAVHVLVWVLHPWRDKKPRTICYAAVGHNRQYCVLEFNYKDRPVAHGQLEVHSDRQPGYSYCQIGPMPDKSFCLPLLTFKLFSFYSVLLHYWPIACLGMSNVEIVLFSFQILSYKQYSRQQ